MKVEITQKKLDNDRINSFWYDGQIAYRQKEHCFYSVEAVGDIRVMFEPDGDTFKNNRAVSEALDRNLRDNDLNKIGTFDGWLANNWFELVCIKPDGSIEHVEDNVAYDYDEAIEMLNNL